MSTVSIRKELFRFEMCAEVPEQGGRWLGGGGLVMDDVRVVWGQGKQGGGVYWLDELVDNDSKRLTDTEKWATLGLCDGRLVSVGGSTHGACSKKFLAWGGGNWSPNYDMLVGCMRSCVVSVGQGGLVVLGGRDDGYTYLDDVQVFNDKRKTWHKGPSLPQKCYAMSAAVHQDLVFVMGGVGMARSVWCAKVSELTSVQTGGKPQSTWRQLPDVPYRGSSACVVDGVLLAIGGWDDAYKATSAMFALHPADQKWQHVGELPFECTFVDTLTLSETMFLLVDGGSRKVAWITAEGLAALMLNGSIQKSMDEKWLYEEAMTKGYVETSVTKCLILGAAGVGKTHLKHLLLKKDPPEQRASTGLADNPVRAISISMASVGSQDEDDWFVIANDQALLSIIGCTIKSGVSMAPSLADVVSTLPKITISVPTNGASISLSDPIPADHDLSTKDTNQHNRTVEKELIHHINNSLENKKLFGVKWIQFIDSGGQLQYHDILPLFVQNLSITIFVLNLSETMSHSPTIEYYGADGKPVGKSYQSAFTHKQILQHCLGAIQSAHPMIIIVGTHRDVEDGCKESRDEKNQQLKSLLDPTCFCVLYNGEGLNHLIFPINGKDPQDVDRHVAQVLRQAILSMSPPQPIKMPIAWFGLEVLLQRSSHDGVLSLTECRACAKSLYIKEDSFSAALHHLVHHNMFLFYPDVLPQTVFCDPQVVLTKVTELVEYHHKLRNNPEEGVAATGDLVKFRDHGLLSVKLLAKFPKHYKEGLFTPLDMLKLLESLHVIAAIRDGEYLMPALLPHLDSDRVSKYCEQSTSLIVKPTQGCIPSGLFCCLVAHLLSPTGPSPWKVCMKRYKPMCLYRNCISFIQSDTIEIVTLVDMCSHIVVHVDEASSQVCKTIRDHTYSGIDSACSLLKYNAVLFEDAFMCAGTSCASDPPHVAVVVVSSRSSNRQVHKWRCTVIGDQSGELSEYQLMWFGESAVAKQEFFPSVPVSLDSEPSLPHLMDKVAAKIPNK